jgi:hypothetical protein
VLGDHRHGITFLGQKQCAGEAAHAGAGSVSRGLPRDDSRVTVASDKSGTDLPEDDNVGHVG